MAGTVAVLGLAFYSVYLATVCIAFRTL